MNVYALRTLIATCPAAQPLTDAYEGRRPPTGRVFGTPIRKNTCSGSSLNTTPLERTTVSIPDRTHAPSTTGSSAYRGCCGLPKPSGKTVRR